MPHPLGGAGARAGPRASSGCAPAKYYENPAMHGYTMSDGAPPRQIIWDARLAIQDTRNGLPGYATVTPPASREHERSVPGTPEASGEHRAKRPRNTGGPEGRASGTTRRSTRPCERRGKQASG